MVGGNKVVATLRADGKVYPTEGTSIGQLANLINYKILTETELAVKSLSTLSVPTTVVDLGKQMLQYARDNDIKGVKYMLSRGAPFTSDWLGMSALHFAAMNNEYDICDALLKGGINKDWKTKVDRTPLHYACWYGNERIAELLLSRKCAVNPKDILRMTPLHWAVEKGFKSIVRLLLKHNADVTCISKFEKTPIALAVQTEQADLLEELEAAKQTQMNRMFSEETEKETSEAVNSIMDFKNDIIEEPLSIRQMDVDAEDELTNQSDFADVKITDFSNIKATGILDDNTVNLLKSHGISMMAEDNDTSKDLLNTALKNGRQLILSEGGKLLLDEAKRTQHQNNQTIKNNNNNNNTSNINNNNNNINNNNKVMSLRIKSESNTPTSTTAGTKIPTLHKIRPNMITKAKDNANSNKNIRIISLNDFKKFYGNSTNLKALQNIPHTRAVRQISSSEEDAEQKMLASIRKLQQSQLKVSHSAAKPSITKAEDNLREGDDEDDIDPMSNIIQVIPTDSEAEASDTDQRQTKSGAPPLRLINTAIGNLNPRRLVDIRPQVKQTVAQTQSNNNKQSAGGETLMVKKATAKPPQQQTSAVIPLLTTPEICRQLYELRKQNEELRRKFEFAHKEKEQMRQRLERMEEFLLLDNDHDGDNDYAQS